jgi:hypothetical protein
VIIVKRGVVLLVPLTGIVGLQTWPALSANDPVRLTFDKAAVAAGAWEGTISGDIEGTLQTVLLTVDETGPIWHVTFDRIIGSGDRSFTARLDGVLNRQTGAVVMDGTVTEGYLLGARVHETGQLADAPTSRFTGSITVFPATQG